MTVHPVACHILDCCCLLGLLRWLDLSNQRSPPVDRVVTCCALVAAASLLSTGLALVNHRQADGADDIRNVRKKSRKSHVHVLLQGSSSNQIGDSGCALIELPAKRKLRKRAGVWPPLRLPLALISFGVLLHVAIVLLGAPFIR